MRILLFMLFLFTASTQAQFTYSGYLYNADASGASNVSVNLYKRTTTTASNNSTSVKIFRTHYGNGNTSQYQQYPSTRSEMDRLFNTSFAATTLWWTGTISGNQSLNFNNYLTLTAAGAAVPNNGDFYSTEITFLFTPQETGNYTFGLTSDDGGDLWLMNYGNVIEWYGGKGTGTYRYGTVSLIANTTYTFIARMQEYGGGDGLFVVWRRPSQSGFAYQSTEVGTPTTSTSAWSLDATTKTNVSGYYSFSRATTANTQWYIQIASPTRIQAYSNTDIQTIANIILNKPTINGLSYHMFDVNDDNKINVADKYYVAARKAGRFSRWRIAPDVRIFTVAEYNTIKLASTNVRNIYPGTATYTTTTLSSGGTLNLYIIAPGYSGLVNY